MPRPPKSQWDFGNLFPAEQTRHVLTVSELTVRVKRLLESQIARVWVQGEISNFRLQSSGHAYFTLKDAQAQLQCVLFRGQTGIRRDLLDDGRKVVLQGDLTVYEPRGQYQLIVAALELQGLGALQQAFERLKQKLSAEGLFDPARKRPLPPCPRCLGIVTSPTGAALRDVLHVIERRDPGLQIILAPCRVQGEGAAREIAEAIAHLNAWALAASPADRPELILVTRGGGSLEDLWAFNEEFVARAIHASALPVISAIGHEIDFTISDFVADLRAATPSAAAELVTEGAMGARAFLLEVHTQLHRHLTRRFKFENDRLDGLASRLGRAHPRRRLQRDGQRLDDLADALRRAARARFRELRSRWDNLESRRRALRPGDSLGQCQRDFLEIARRFRELGRTRVESLQRRVAEDTTRLQLLSPAHTLARGYSITADAATGRILRRAADTRPGQALRTRLHEGEIQSVVTPPATRTDGPQPPGCRP